MKVVQLPVLRGPWWHQVCRDTDCLCRRRYGPLRVFFRAFFSWQSEGLFGQSFSVAPPVQALTGLPCLGSFSVVQLARHMEGSYSVVQCVRHLMGQALYCSAGVWGQRGYSDGSTPMHDSAVSPCFHGCLDFLHRHFPRSPPSHPLDPSL